MQSQGNIYDELFSVRTDSNTLTYSFYCQNIGLHDLHVFTASLELVLDSDGFLHEVFFLDRPQN